MSSLARRIALNLLDGGMIHQRPDVAVHLLMVGICRWGQVTLEHRGGRDVLARPHKLQEPVGIPSDVLLDMPGVFPRAA